MMSMTFRSSFRAISEAGLPLEEMAARLNTLHWQEEWIRRTDAPRADGREAFVGAARAHKPGVYHCT